MLFNPCTLKPSKKFKEGLLMAQVYFEQFKRKIFCLSFYIWEASFCKKQLNQNAKIRFLYKDIFTRFSVEYRFGEEHVLIVDI